MKTQVVPLTLPIIREKTESTALLNVKDVLFTAPIVFGNKQTFMMDLDTGSSDTWIRGPKCKSTDKSCTGAFVNLADKTLIDTGKVFRTDYGSGSATGEIVIAKIALGSQTVSMPVGVTTEERGFENFDGLLGLGFDSESNIGKSTKQNANFMDALFSSGMIERNMVSFHLSSEDNGVVTFGGIDESKFTGKIQLLPITSKSLWQIDFSSATFRINAKKGTLAGKKKNILVDTGSTLMTLEEAPATAINSALGATKVLKGTFTFPSCEIAFAAPDVEITLSDTKYVIPASVYVRKVKDECISGISAGDVPLLGDIWIMAVYTIFDKTNSQIGFAKSINV